MSRRVQHRDTGVRGTVTHAIEQLGGFDGDLTGPWSYVQFDDGFRCWVRDINLTDEGESVTDPNPDPGPTWERTEYERGRAAMHTWLAGQPDPVTAARLALPARLATNDTNPYNSGGNDACREVLSTIGVLAATMEGWNVDELAVLDAILDRAHTSGRLAAVTRDLVGGLRVHAVWFADGMHSVVWEIALGDEVSFGTWWSDGPRTDFQTSPDLDAALRYFARNITSVLDEDAPDGAVAEWSATTAARDEGVRIGMRAGIEEAVAVLEATGAELLGDAIAEAREAGLIP